MIRGVVRNGRIELLDPLDLPDGTEVMIAPDSGDQPLAPDDIARIAAATTHFSLSPEEEAEWQAERAKRQSGH